MSTLTRRLEAAWAHRSRGDDDVDPQLVQLAPEAEKRLDESGAAWRYKPSPNSGYPNGIP